MKRLFSLLSLLTVTMMAQAQTNRLYVSPTGNDTNSGSLNRPFQTIDRALEEAAQYTNDTVDIRLRGGIYPLQTTVKIIGQRNVTVSPYDGEQVSVIGGRRLSSRNLTKITDKAILSRLRPEVREQVRQIDTKSLGIDIAGLSAKGFGRSSLPAWSEVFIDGAPLKIARWPNDSTVLIGKVHCTGDIPRHQKFGIGDPVFEYQETRPNEWQSVEGAWIGGYFAHGYADDMVSIKSIDTVASTITAGEATLYGFISGASFRRWYAMNLLEEIDLPGEYIIDQPNGKIYLLPTEGALKDIYITTLETPIFAIEKSTNVTVRGLTLEYSRGMGVYIEESDSVRIDSCVIRNLGYVGVSIGRGDTGSSNNDKSQTTSPDGVPYIIGTLGDRLYTDRLFNRRAGSYNGVSNSHIYQVGSGGISIGGGDRATLTAAHNYVENCRIHDFNRIERSYRAGISIDGVGNRISNCEIFDAPSMAILLGGNDHTIEYSDIHHVCQEIDDQGAIYYGRDPSELGNKIRFTYMHHIGSGHNAMATYHDDGACGMEVFGCVYYKAGPMNVLIGGGHDNVYRNNIFIDTPLAIHIDNRMQHWGKSSLDKDGIFEKRLKTVRYDEPPYSTAYPGLADYWSGDPSFPRGNVIAGNVFFKVKRITDGSLDYAEWTNNWITSKNPGFVDPKDPKRGFVPDAPLYQKVAGFTPIPFERIGCLLPTIDEN